MKVKGKGKGKRLLDSATRKAIRDVAKAAAVGAVMGAAEEIAKKAGHNGNGASRGFAKKSARPTKATR